MRIPMTDVRLQYETLKPEIDAAIKRVCESGQFILGPEVEAFEQEMAEYLDVRYAVGVASGTDALHLALLACGVGPGDEVITTPFTFIATSEAIVKCGAKPVFVDIEPRTFNIDVDKVDRAITDKTTAILPVHLYGQPANMRDLPDLGAHGYLLPIIEDCAQSLGADHEGRKAGSLGDIGCFSFFPSKNLGAFGDGGMVVTSHAGVYYHLRQLRNHGTGEPYCHVKHGLNSRLDALQAAILRVKLTRLNAWNKARSAHAARYSELLGSIDGITVPYVAPCVTPSWNYYTVRLDSWVDRERLRQHLADKGIGTAVYYPIPLHLQPVYRDLGYYIGDFPEAEKASREVLSLPMYPELTTAQIEEVCTEIERGIA